MCPGPRLLPGAFCLGGCLEDLFGEEGGKGEGEAQFGTEVFAVFALFGTVVGIFGIGGGVGGEGFDEGLDEAIGPSEEEEFGGRYRDVEGEFALGVGVACAVAFVGGRDGKGYGEEVTGGTVVTLEEGIEIDESFGWGVEGEMAQDGVPRLFAERCRFGEHDGRARRRSRRKQ